LNLTKLLDWVNDKAFPLWWKKGADFQFGGFHEKLDPEARPILLPKRGRVLPRQIYAYSQAKELGWKGDAASAVKHGLDFYLAHYFRDDGLVRTLVAPDGACLDDRADFYDQAFALLGLHSAYKTLGDAALVQRARHLMAVWSATQKHPEIGFVETQANPHMHLFESCQAWAEADPEGPWQAIADEICRLALNYLIDGKTGALRESFAPDWSQGHGVEPGHQFEWGWLLMRHGAVEAGLRLVEIGETQGVDPKRGVAFNSSEDLRARLWPQTERIKAHCLAAELTGKAEHRALAEQAAAGLMLYFATPIPGLWFDMLSEDGKFTPEPSPASSFYHIVCAIAEYRRSVATGR
jgi:mannose/cellobiose epimerase-like protein (N-acyl-D-glucosamine 2-epimerase family)